MTKLAAAGRNFLALGAGNYGAMGVGLAVNVLLTRRLGTQGYGYLALLLMVSQVALQLTVQWSNTGFIRFGAREFAEKRTVSDALWARLAIVLPALALAIVLLTAARGPLASYLQVPSAAIWIVAAHLMAIGALSVVGAVFQAIGQMARYGVCLLLDKSVMLALLVALPPAWSSSPVVILGCYTASSLAVALWGIAVTRRAIRFALPAAAEYRRMALFSVPVLLSSWTGLFGANWFDLLILKAYVPMSSIGLYSLSTQLAGVVQQITVIFATLVLPPLSVMVAEGQDARIRTFVERMLPYWLLGTSVLFSLVVFGARIAIPLAFGPSFADAAPIVALLMVATSGSALFHSCAPLVAAYGSMWVVSAASIVSAVANVVLDLVLIPRFGVLGSAAATVLAYGISATVVLAFVHRKFGGKVLRLAWLGAPVLVACICFLMLDGGWFYLVAPIAASATALGLAASFRLFHREDAVFLNNLRPLISG